MLSRKKCYSEKIIEMANCLNLSSVFRDNFLQKIVTADTQNELSTVKIGITFLMETEMPIADNKGAGRMA